MAKLFLNKRFTRKKVSEEDLGKAIDIFGSF